MTENPYMMLAKVILPSEMTEYFDLVKVRTDEYSGEPRLHLYLDEKDKAPDARTDLSPNGFYEESCMNDFPIREYRTVLHVRRRRFLKEFLGYIPDYGQIAPETISRKG